MTFDGQEKAFRTCQALPGISKITVEPQKRMDLSRLVDLKKFDQLLAFVYFDFDQPLEQI